MFFFCRCTCLCLCFFGRHSQRASAVALAFGFALSSALALALGLARKLKARPIQPRPKAWVQPPTLPSGAPHSLIVRSLDGRHAPCGDDMARRHSMTARIMLLTAFALIGCREKLDKSDISWSTQASSPDKHWLAIAHREAGGSFGGGYASTVVSLKQADQPPAEILGLDDLLSEQSLHLNWVDARHLEILSDIPVPTPEIFFQAIRCGDVTISLVAPTTQVQPVTPRGR